jgi:hypothetical protein
MRTISEQKVGRSDGALGRSLRIAGFTKVLGGNLFFALLHSPVPALSATVPPRQSVTLAWNQSTDPTVVGYTIYFGGASGKYTNTLPAGNATNATISGLIPGTTYYFAATTYNSSGVQSPFSNEASYSVPTNAVPTPSPGVQLRVTPTRQFILTVTGPVGHTYDIQASQDLKTWTVIGTVTVGASGSVDFTDTNAASFSRRFYRTRG